MWTLIKRELDEALAFIAFILLLTGIFSIIAILILSNYYRDQTNNPPMGIPIGLIGIFFLMLFFIPLVFASMGSSLMRSDQKNKISTFLCTLASSRRKIFAARTAAGVILASFATILPVICLFVGFKIYPRLIPINTTLLWQFAGVFLSASIASYACGMQTAFIKNRFFQIFSFVSLSFLIFTIIPVKGLGYSAIVLINLIAVAGFIRAWQKYESSSL